MILESRRLTAAQYIENLKMAELPKSFHVTEVITFILLSVDLEILSNFVTLLMEKISLPPPKDLKNLKPQLALVM